MNAPDSSSFQVVGSRVDALVLAYRVDIEEGMIRSLKSASDKAKKFGRAYFQWESIVGELRFSRTEKAWFVVTPRYRLRVLLAAPGGVELPDGRKEPGWTLEIMWNAQALAVMSLSGARIRSRAIAKTCGRIYASRLRRLDLCADLAGWALERTELDRFVRRPNSGVSGNAFAEREIAAMLERGDFADDAPEDRVVMHYKKNLTGWTFCPGGELLSRVYDKRAELALKKSDIRRDEEKRWRAGGWDGQAPVTRVEFQIRGGALAEFGLRDPDHPVELGKVGGKVVEVARWKGLESVVDRVWRACLMWLRLAEPGQEAERAARKKLDPRWVKLFAVQFVQAVREAHARVRVRAGATIEQAFGCVLSVLGSRGELSAPRGQLTVVDEAAARTLVVRQAKYLFERAGEIAGDHFAKKRGPFEAVEYVRELVSASWARFTDGEADVLVAAAG